VFVGVVLVFGAGIVMPYLAPLPILFNLHLLRADGFIHFLAVAVFLRFICRQLADLHYRDEPLSALEALALVSFLLTDWFLLGGSFLLLSLPRNRRWQGLAAVATLAMIGASIDAAADPMHDAMTTGAATVTFLAFAMLADRFRRRRVPAAVSSPPAWEVGAVLVAVPAVAFALHRIESTGSAMSVLVVSLISCIAFLRLARVVLPGRQLLAIMVLATLPVSAARWATTSDRIAQLAASPWADLLEWVGRQQGERAYLVQYPMPGEVYDVPDFQFVAKAPLWIDQKRGAAAMWAPEFHEIWRTRMAVWTGLSSPGEYLDFACEQGITHIVFRSDEELPEGTSVVYVNGGYQVAATEASCFTLGRGVLSGVSSGGS
jgi:hypothetical protein